MRLFIVFYFCVCYNGLIVGLQVNTHLIGRYEWVRSTSSETVDIHLNLNTFKLSGFQF
jgi:hypothetical protein